MKTFALLLLLTMSASAMDRLDALWMMETGGNDQAIGKAGERSRFQVKGDVWQTVTRSRDYARPDTARMVASRVMGRRVSAFASQFGRQPTDFEYYALWNAPTQVMSGRVSPKVSARCQRFCNLCARDRVGR